MYNEVVRIARLFHNHEKATLVIATAITMKLLTDFTKLSKVIGGVIVIGYFVQLIAPSTRGVFALVPGRFLPCVWNIFTAGLLEVHFYKVSAASTLNLIDPMI